MADDTLTADEQRLHTFLSRPDVPDAAKRQAVSLYRQATPATPLPTDPGAAAGAIVGRELKAAGVKPDPSESEPTLRTAGAEMAGGTLGEAIGGPIGSGFGTLVAGTAEDLSAGRRPTLGREAMRFASSAVVPPVVGAAFKGAGQVLGAGTRAISERLPSFAEFAERVAPGVLRRAPRAAEATGDLAHIPSETVISRFRDWSKGVFDHVNELAGDAPVVPTSNLKAAAEGIRGVPGLSKVEQQAFKEAMGSDAVSFQTARHLESGFQRLARTRIGQKAMGDTVSHQWSSLADAVGSDLDEFLSTPEAASSGVGEALSAAKATYREGKQAMSATELYRRSITPGGHFDARRFASNVKRLDDKGILSRVVGADRAPVLRQLAGEFGGQTEASHTIAGKIARKVGYAAPFAGALGAEEMYRRGAITPERVAGAGLTLGMLHPAGRALMSTLAGQGAAAALRQQSATPSDFIRFLGAQGFSP